jgi:hypothetical protein
MYEWKDLLGTIERNVFKLQKDLLPCAGAMSRQSTGSRDPDEVLVGRVCQYAV